jgi:hypothetical protein
MSYDDQLKTALTNAARYEAMRKLQAIGFHDPETSNAIKESIDIEDDDGTPACFDRFADQLIQALEEADITIITPEREAS